MRDDLRSGPLAPGRAVGSAGAAGAAAAADRGAPAPAAPPSGPGRVNHDLDLDDVDPKGTARRKAAKEAARQAGTRRGKVMKITALATAGTLVAVAGAGFFVVQHLLGNVQTVSLGSLKNRPAASKANAEGETPLDILVLGSQTRDGQTQAAHVGNSSKDGTDLSDTAFIVHIAADRKWAEVISIPRDLFVPIPACQDRTTPGQIDAAQSEGQFYDAMGEGGPACAVATVEQMTDIRMDHFLELTFDAFIDLTNAVDGVQICVPEPGIDDPNYSGLVLSAGLHTVVGNQALAFVRDRHGLAGGMDTSRIQMQQQFMTALFNKLTSNGTLEDPLTLYKIADAISNNITVDNGTDIDGEAHNAVTNLAALGMNASVGNGGYSNYSTTTIFYPSGDQAEADTVANEVVGASVQESPSVSEVTLVIGANAPSAIVSSPSASADSDSGSSASTSTSPSPTPSISVEARSGNENICPNLPAGQYGGSPDG